MLQILKNIHNLIRLVCQPNPKVYPNTSIKELVWNANINKIYTNIIFLIVFPIFARFSKFSLSTSLVLMSQTFTLLFVQIFLCRSYIWAFNLYYACALFIYTYFVLDMVKEAVYFQISVFFVYPIAIATWSGDVKLAFLTGFAQSFAFMTKVKEKMVFIIEEEGPEIFAESFLKTSLFLLLIVLLIILSLITALEKQTIELGKAKSALEGALDQQRTFILSFSHELRNPINSLLGNLQLVLQGETLSGKATEMINIAKVCGEILLHNINNVLDTGKQEIGKLEVNPVLTQLPEMFQRTWSIYSELLKQKKLKSQLKIEKDLPVQVRIDSHKVNQVLLNLIGNSIKFTEKGSVVVTIKWLNSYSEVCDKCFEPIPYDDIDEGLFEKQENLSTVNTSRISESRPGFRDDQRQADFNENDRLLQHETKGVIKIVVKDTGSGMKKEALERLFIKFSQVSDNISDRQIGTGLGLYITKEICQAMNGEIRVYSKPRIGTTVVVCIPAVAIPLNRRQRANPLSIINSLTSKHLKGIVADDSPFNVNLMCNYFSQFGASVVSVAYNGSDAFMKYKECRMTNVEIDVVILDIDMPVMDGLKACDKIREYERAHRLKPVLIILMSGNYDLEQIGDYISSEREGIGHKADSFLRKPVSFSEFNRAIYNLLTPH